MKSIRDTLRLSSINIVEVNKEIFINHGSDSFGQDETFVLKILQQKGVVSDSIRHGLSKENEADIVDEISGEQYEITYEFKTTLPKRLMKPDFLYSPEVLALQLVDSPFIHPSNSLDQKLKKVYTKKYRQNLVVLTLGTAQSTITMLESLSEKLKKEEIEKLNYANIYIIVLNFLSEQAFFVKISATGTFVSESFPCKNEELGFIQLTPISFSAMEDDGEYLIICDSIFEKKYRVRYDKGQEIKSWVKTIRLWGI